MLNSPYQARAPASFPVEPGEAKETLEKIESLSTEELFRQAVALRHAAHGTLISFSPKVFIPLTRLCRDVCAYCTFAGSPIKGQRGYLTHDEVLAIARSGVEAGCFEALFTLGEQPEHRYAVARRELNELGFATTIEYLVTVAGLVLRETGLLPHINAGLLTGEEIAALRSVSASQGLMLESTSQALFEKGGPHFGSVSKKPENRIETIAQAGRQSVPFTTGILIGIGETRYDRIHSLMTIAALHERYGHIQEVIVQNFRPKPGTRMAGCEAPSFEELLFTAAAARLILGPQMNIQVPPNLSFDRFPDLLKAGINDWGGVSPVTPDHVNPEAAWPSLERLRECTEAQGYVLVPRLPVYPASIEAPARWFAPNVAKAVLTASDGEGWARFDKWSPGSGMPPPLGSPVPVSGDARRFDNILTRAMAGHTPSTEDVSKLLTARGSAEAEITIAADELRRRVSGEQVRYVVNRNINYTNVCTYHCRFCAFSKGKTADNLRDRPYVLDFDEVARRSAEAWSRGATEVCMQGGIHPNYTGRTYLGLLKAAKSGAPSIHAHSFSPLEICHGAETLDVSIDRFLGMLQDEGLDSLPGTAAEILHDDVRALICPDKLDTESWLRVIETAHGRGIPTTATIMFGHVERAEHCASHLLRLRALQQRFHGFTEFVPLPFVHMEAPLYYHAGARKGPTFRETVLMHAVARLVLHPHIPNIQVSWVKLGREAAAHILNAGANDLGGTLMNESISRAAGTQHGQEFPPQEMEALISKAGRVPRQRTTLYGAVRSERNAASKDAAPLMPLVMGSARNYNKRSRERT